MNIRAGARDNSENTVRSQYAIFVQSTQYFNIKLRTKSISDRVVTVKSNFTVKTTV